METSRLAEFLILVLCYMQMQRHPLASAENYVYCSLYNLNKVATDFSICINIEDTNIIASR
jgi:hypothetical protein